MRVGLLTQWYDPEPGPAALPGVLARGLRDRGHDVHVVTGFPNYPTGRVADGYRVARVLDESRDGVRVRRVAMYPSHDASAVRRLANFTSFGASALASGTSVLATCDAVWVNYSPITVALPMWAARYTARVPMVVHVLDLWPDTIFAADFARTGTAGRIVERAASAWCTGMYAAADSVAYISPGVGSRLEDRGVPADKLHYIPMWADEETFQPTTTNRRASLGLAEDEVVVLYAGTLGEAQGLKTLIEACARITDRRFVALIAGSGTAEGSLRQLAHDLSVTNVRFLGRVPQTDMTELMATADLCYVGLRTHPLSEITMPSKTQAALASGKPLLMAASGDAQRLVSQAGIGFTADPGDPASIAAALNEACRVGRPGLATMGSGARSLYTAKFSSEAGVDAIERLLTNAANRRKQ